MAVYISLMDEIAEMVPLPMISFFVVPLVLHCLRYSILLDLIPCSHVQDLDTSINILSTLLPISFSSSKSHRLSNARRPQSSPSLQFQDYRLSATTMIDMRLRYPVTIPNRQVCPIYLPVRHVVYMQIRHAVLGCSFPSVWSPTLRFHAEKATTYVGT